MKLISACILKQLEDTSHVLDRYPYLFSKERLAMLRRAEGIRPRVWERSIAVLVRVDRGTV